MNTKHFTLIMIAALGLSALAGCGASMKLNTATNSQANFSNLKTYAFVASDASTGFKRTLIDGERLEVARSVIPSSLASRGWKPTSSDHADVIIQAGLGRRQTQEIGHLYHHGNETSTGGHSEIGHSGEFVDSATELETEIDERSIVFDVFDRESGLCIWHGAVSSKHSARDLSADDFRESLKLLLARFPSAGMP